MFGNFCGGMYDTQRGSEWGHRRGRFSQGLLLGLSQRNHHMETTAIPSCQPRFTPFQSQMLPCSHLPLTAPRFSPPEQAAAQAITQHQLPGERAERTAGLNNQPDVPLSVSFLVGVLT